MYHHVDSLAGPGSPGRGQMRGLRHKVPDTYLIALFFYAPMVTAIGVFLELPRDTVALISYSLSVLIAAKLYLVAKSVYGLKPNFRTGAPILVFCAVMVFTSLLAIIAGIRSDSLDMAKQLVMGLLPVVLFFGSQRISLKMDVSVGVEKGIKALAALSAASIGLEFLGILTYESYGARHFGFLSDGSAWLVAFVCVVFFSQKKFFLFALMLTMLALTASRGAALVFFISVLLLLLTAQARYSRRMVNHLFIIILGGAAVFWFNSDILQSLFQRFAETNFLVNDRVWTMLLSWELFSQSPVFGSGFNAQQHFFPKEDLLWKGILGFSTPTSTTIQMLADAGVVGFAAFIAVVISFTKRAWKILRTNIYSREYILYRGLSAWLIAFLIFNQSAAWLLPGSYLSPIVFAVAGLIAGSARRLAASQASHPPGCDSSMIQDLRPRA